MPTRAARPKTQSAKVGDSAKKTARTGVQGAIAVTVLIQGINLFLPHPMSSEQTTWATVAGTAIVTFVMNLLEENGMPALLKGPSVPAPPSVDLDARKFEALATAISDQHNELLSLRADIRALSPPIFTGQVHPSAAAPWPPGGLG